MYYTASMQKISKHDVAELIGLEIMAELHQIREKLAYFKKKYGSYDDARTASRGSREIFDLDDDLMEWEAYINLEKDRIGKLEDIRHERFQVA
jgi:hypothetical protein